MTGLAILFLVCAAIFLELVDNAPELPPED